MKAIEIEELRKVLGGRPVLNGISFSVDEGEVFGYLGPNGAGKTTTMRVLLGLLRPTSGTALVKGADLAVDDEARRGIGVLMENDGLYDRLSAYQNLDYYARIYSVPDRGRRIASLLERMGLTERMHDRVYAYSKGMRRKLGIARAIIHEPDILLLDEPTSGLDPEAQRMVREILLDLSRRERMTVFLSSHNLDEVQRICRRVAVIKAGVLRACDTVDGLREGHGGHTAVITLGDAAEGARAAPILSALPEVISFQQSGSQLTVAHVDETTWGIITALVRGGVRVEEVRKASRSLEDVYIDLVKEEASA